MRSYCTRSGAHVYVYNDGSVRRDIRFGKLETQA